MIKRNKQLNTLTFRCCSDLLRCTWIFFFSTKKGTSDFPLFHTCQLSRFSRSAQVLVLLPKNLPGPPFSQMYLNLHPDNNIAKPSFTGRHFRVDNNNGYTLKSIVINIFRFISPSVIKRNGTDFTQSQKKWFYL